MAERAPLSTLSSLLAAHGVPMRAIEDAIARQVVHGSDLATNLLEVGGIGEEQLLEALAEASSLEAAPLGSLAVPSPAVLALVPADLQQRESIFPLSFAHGVLRLAVAEPFVSAAELGLGQVRQIIAPLARIRQAISKVHKIPLERRLTRLLGKLGEPAQPPPVAAKLPKFEIDDEPTQISPLPKVEVPSRPATQTPATLIAGANPSAVPTVSPDKLNTTPPGPPVHLINPTPVRKAIPLDSKEFAVAPTVPQHLAGEVALAKGTAPVWATRPPVVQVVQPTTEWRPLTSDDMPETVPAPRLTATVNKTEAKAEEDDEAAPVSRRTAALRSKETARGRAAGGFFRKTVLGEAKAREARKVEPDAPPPPQERKGSVRVRRKGPFTTQMAEEELGEATATDVVLDILFTFAQQFFEYTVLFVVSGEVADGRDAFGPGLTSARVKSLKIPLDQPSILQLARERKAPVTAVPVAHGVDAQIVRELGREARFEEGQRASMAILPIVVKSRVVALLLGDDGSVDVDLSALGEVVIIAGRTVEALERIILRKKLGAAGRSPSVMPPPGDALPDRPEGLRPVGLAALARALDSTSGVDSEDAVSSEQAASLPPTKSAPTATLLSAAALRSMEAPTAPVVRQDHHPDVLPRNSRQAARSSGTNRTETSSSTTDTPDGDVPEPAATSERSGPGSRRRRFLTGPASRPRIAPMAVSEGGAEASSDSPQPTLQGTPRSQRRGASSLGRGRAGTMVAPRPLPPNLAGKSAMRVPPARSLSGEKSPSTIAGPPLPPTVQVRRGSSEQTAADPTAQQAERETVTLLQKFVGSNGADNDAGQAIVQLGKRAVPVIMARFPGPLAPGLSSESTDLPPASSCGPLFALLVAIGADAVVHVAQRASSILTEDRFWAAHLLGEIATSESAEIVGTLLFDDDLAVRRMARRSAGALLAAMHEAASAAIVPMLEQAARGSSEWPGRRFIALETLGELAVPSTIPTLIAMLGESVQDVVDAVHRALVQITCQDFGRDARRWIDWFAANAGRHRVEWIIDTLLSESAELRRISAEALAPVIGRDLGFDPEGGRDERAAAHVRYLLWWEQEGRKQFGH